MTSEARFNDILEDFALLGVTRTTSFGKRGMTADGKVIACFLDDAVAFKLGAGTPEHAKALALDGSELWDPSGRNRPFKDWVRVTEAHGDDWAHFAEVALQQIRAKL